MGKVETNKVDFESGTSKIFTTSSDSERRLTEFDSPGDSPNNGRKSQINEASEIYGDYQTAEEFGYVTRGLKSRHIQFIALGGTIGTGLFLGIGRALTQAGPLSVLLGYMFTGTVIYALMQSLGEMATWLPLPGSIPTFCSRYIDPAVGFAVGWNSWIYSSLSVCAEISTAAIIISFWSGAQDTNPAAWITIIIVLIICLNIFAVAIYGEAEFWFASLKILAIVGLIIFAIVIDLGGGPTRDRLGFRFWSHPGAMKPYIADGSAGRFLGLWSVLVNAAFAYAGVEMVAVAAGESENPRQNIPRAIRRVFWRILFFYVIGSLAIGVLVPYNEPLLLDAQTSQAPGAAASPWVIAVYRAGIPVIPSIINTVVLVSVVSSSNAFLYIGSRYLYALAQNGQAPRFLLTCSKNGVPYYCVLCTGSVSLLTYMSCSKGSNVVFQWFQNIVSISILLIWMSVAVAYIRFHAALKAQGVDRNTLVFKSMLQPYTAWFALISFALITFFNGFWTFPSPTRAFDASGFITAYIGLPVYFGLYLFWKIFKRTSMISADEADIYTGKAAVDAVQWPERQPRNWWERLWFWIA